MCVGGGAFCTQALRGLKALVISFLLYCMHAIIIRIHKVFIGSSMYKTLTQWAHSLLFAVDKHADCSQSLIFP